MMHTPDTTNKKGNRLNVVIRVLFFLALILFVVLAYLATTGHEYSFDRAVSNLFARLATPSMVGVMERITFLGSSAFLFPAYAVLVGLLLLRKRFQVAIHVAVIGFTAYALTNGLKALLNRKRPGEPLIEALTTGSFPSGHTVSSFVFCMILAWLVYHLSISRAAKIIVFVLLVVLSLLIGISRIILNMHYPTDVVGGYCLGIVWIILSYWNRRV